MSPVYTALYDPHALGDPCPPTRVRASYLTRIPLCQPLVPAARAALSARVRVVRPARIRRDRQLDDRVGEGRERPRRRRACLLHQYRQPFRLCTTTIRRARFARPIVDAWSPGTVPRPRGRRTSSRTRATSRARIEKFYGRESRRAALPRRPRSFYRRPRRRRLFHRRHRGCCPTSASTWPFAPPHSPTFRCSLPEPARQNDRCASWRAERRRRCSDTSRIGASTSSSATRARRSCRAKKTSAWSRSRRPPPDGRRSRTAAAARSKRSSRARPGRSSTIHAGSLAAALRTFDSSRSTRSACARTPSSFRRALHRRLRDIVDRVYRENRHSDVEPMG